MTVPLLGENILGRRGEEVELLNCFIEGQLVNHRKRIRRLLENEQELKKLLPTPRLLFSPIHLAWNHPQNQQIPSHNLKGEQQTRISKTKQKQKGKRSQGKKASKRKTVKSTDEAGGAQAKKQLIEPSIEPTMEE